ncbi:MAG: PKD domain-containing protein [Candidatus Thermoplasmatota archaeon]|nr:PKD domain-containing protein [Candidatus Thermoplasmatota archaeon]
MGRMKAISIYIASIILFCPLVVMNVSESEAWGYSFGGGSGTKGDPYIIEDVWDLQNMSRDLSAHYVLGNDINASDTINWNSGAGFDPIGKANSPFIGSLDGKNHTISGLFIDSPNTDYYGLFGYTGSGASVKCISIVDQVIKGSKYVGAIVGWNEKGLISDCFVTRTKMDKFSYLGGIVGYNLEGIILNCTYQGIVKGYAYSMESHVGGIVGNNVNGMISNCNMIGNVTGSYYVGGILGYNDGFVSNCNMNGSVKGSQFVGGIIGADVGTIENCHSSAIVIGFRNVGGLIGWKKGTMSNCYSTGNLNVSDSCVGGLIGTLNQGIVSNCWATGKVFSRGYYIGGLVGSNYGRLSNCHSSCNISGSKEVGGLVGRNGGRISDCYLMGSVTGSTSVGGLVGYNYGKLSNSHYNIESISINNGIILTIGGLFEDQYKDWLSNDLTLDINDYESSLALYDGYYHIDNIQGIRDMLGFSDVEGYRFRFSQDIDLSSEPGLYLPYFGASELDGNNHTITNLSLDLSFVSNIGMVGYNNHGIIKNLRIINNNVSGYENVGGLLGYNNNGDVFNCYASGTVNSIFENTGGLVGLSSGMISDCFTNVNISGTDINIGGLAGKNNGKIFNCQIKADVNGTFSVGGLLGLNEGIVSNCIFTGNVSGTSSTIGGLVGGNQGKISNSYAKGNISGRYSIGGLVGYNNIENGEISNCNSMGNAVGVMAVGGLVGTNEGSVVMSVAKGNISGKEYVGGFVGSQAGSIFNCYSTGSVTRVSGNYTSFGGFAGINIRKIINCYSSGRVIYDNEEDPRDKGFVGSVNTKKEYEMRGNFWDNETSHQTTTSGEAIGMNTTMMKTRKMFTDAGWDLRNVWCMIEKETYPFLRWQDTKTPIANAGPDLIVDEGTFVVFDGSGSYDDMGIADYLWSFIDNKPVTLYGVKPAYQFNNPGFFIITLNVQDAVDTWGSDTMRVTVLDISPPSANAGLDLTVDEGTVVTFDGNGSFDNVGIVNWTWTFADGDPIVLYGMDPSYQFKTPGAYEVILNVTDEAGHWSTDSMTVTVRDITAPVAVAGPDLIVDEGSIVFFDGSGSSDNVGIFNYTWTFLDGISIALYGPQPEYKFNNLGAYIVTLNVSDAAGNWATATMKVTVRDITSPISNAGQDQRVAVGSTVVLNGIMSTDNVGIVRYSWTFTYDGVENNLVGVVVEFVFGKAGTYEIKLKVFDEYDNSAEDTVLITVIDTGIVKGIVLDDKGVPVEGSLIEITASNGREFTFTTGENGSFALIIPHGSFEWRISKSGYVPISGTSRVDPMGEVELDLSGTPLVKEKGSSPSIVPYLILAAILILLIAGILLIAWRRGSGSRSRITAHRLVR